VSERWIVVMNTPNPRGSTSEMYFREFDGWWSDQASATVYPSKEEAERMAFRTVTEEPSLIGCVLVEKAS